MDIHYVYEIRCNINNMIYVGKGSCNIKTNPINHSYMGSGLRIKRAIKKYGKQNFTKTIIDVCESAEQAYELEALIVNEEFILRPDTFNIDVGGYARTSISQQTRKKMSLSHTGKLLSDEHKQKLSLVGIGRKHTEKTKQKIKEHSTKFSNPIEVNCKISLLLSSNIDFTKFGWVGKAAIIIGITPQKVNNWMKRNMLDFYESTCFKRNSQR